MMDNTMMDKNTPLVEECDSEINPWVSGGFPVGFRWVVASGKWGT